MTYNVFGGTLNPTLLLLLYILSVKNVAADLTLHDKVASTNTENDVINLFI